MFRDVRCQISDMRMNGEECMYQLVEEQRDQILVEIPSTFPLRISNMAVAI
jgi:hypothetical protein